MAGANKLKPTISEHILDSQVDPLFGKEAMKIMF
jgi:hypothetical protein